MPYSTKHLLHPPMVREGHQSSQNVLYECFLKLQPRWSSCGGERWRSTNNDRRTSRKTSHGMAKRSTQTGFASVLNRCKRNITRKSGAQSIHFGIFDMAYLTNESTSTSRFPLRPISSSSSTRPSSHDVDDDGYGGRNATIAADLTPPAALPHLLVFR